RERRALLVRIGGNERLIAVEDAARYRDAFGIVFGRGVPDAFLEPTKDALTGLVLRHARTHGPFRGDALTARWGIGEASVDLALERLVAEGRLVCGVFLEKDARARKSEYCDPDVLKTLKQKTLARLRKTIEPVSLPAFARFLLAWHRIDVDVER